MSHHQTSTALMDSFNSGHFDHTCFLFIVMNYSHFLQAQTPIVKTTIVERHYTAQLLKDHDHMTAYVFFWMEVLMSTTKTGDFSRTLTLIKEALKSV